MQAHHDHGEARLGFWLGFGLVAGLNSVLSYLGVAVAGYVVLGLALVLLARFIYKLAHRVFTVDLLMSIVGFVGFTAGIAFEVSIVYILYAVAEVSEAYVERLARKRIAMLEKLLPDRVLVVKPQGVEEVPVSRVKVGDLVLVRPGEVIPVDGVAMDSGVVDTRLVTGEHERRTVRPGDTVESGYLNAGRTPLRVRALKTVGSSLLAVLVRTAEEVLERKARIQRLLERLAPPYTLVVLAVFAALYLLLGPYKSLVVLLAGCPSAFIVVSSFTTVYTVSILAGRSVLVKGGPVLEALSRCRVVVLDKTGTLTLGELRVSKVVPAPGYDAETVLTLACGAAKASKHPASRALAVHCQLAPEKAQEVPGEGVIAEVNGRRVVLGSRSFLASSLGGDLRPLSCVEGKEVYVAIDGRYAGTVCLEEVLADEAKAVIERLRSMGLHVVVSSGDRREAVEAVALKLGISEYYYRMKPHDKLELIKKLRQKFNSPVAMVGDGINDVEALAGADVGIAVGSIDVVAEVADAVLARGIGDLPNLIGASRSFAAALALGFTVAIIVKLVAMLSGFLGLVPLWVVAAIGDDGATVLGVLTSALTLLGQRYA
jgi:Cd2+/Zn2+-exporting ATPase